MAVPWSLSCDADTSDEHCEGRLPFAIREGWSEGVYLLEEEEVFPCTPSILGLWW